MLSFTAFTAHLCGVCGLLLLSGGKEGWFGGKWLREREERVENQKHKSNCNSLKATTHFD